MTASFPDRRCSAIRCLKRTQDTEYVTTPQTPLIVAVDLHSIMIQFGSLFALLFDPLLFNQSQLGEDFIGFDGSNFCANPGAFLHAN